ncbi:rRNA (guanine-N2)-methyltransferase [Enemella evansiae]|uniref:class I SAM-dependent methyltransferase n=1 Tax=Enemella evansiae TaxID=2016499 RepID=UPI000B97C57F|nr:methyltransferase [Enemella evansiae]OYO00613.1 rRNA (guanine-N2)-methyltransferase [Enemella evansiae]
MDPVDSLIWDEAQELIGDTDPGPVLVLDSPALAAAARERWPRVRAYADLLGSGSDSDALDATGARLVLGRLPKSLGALSEYAQRIAAAADEGVRLLLGGRVKHMTRSMNDTLATRFAEVRASRGRQKSRVLHAGGPRPGPIDWPRRQHHDDLGLTLYAHGATFGGTKVDPGTRLLVGALDQLTGPPAAAVDLGCGNGTLTALLARRGWPVTGIDNSRAAVAATGATLTGNGLDGRVVLADGLTGVPDDSLDLIVCNPPFHVGTAKDSTPALRMFADAGRVLRPGGEFWAVWNAHLPYLPALRRGIGPTTIVTRDPQFIVTRSTSVTKPI